MEDIEFNIEKQINNKKVVFHFKAYKEIDEYDHLKIKYNYDINDKKIRNKHNNGWFSAQDISEEHKAILLYTTLDITGKKINGISIDDETFNKLLKMKEEAIKNREERKQHEFKNNLTLHFYFGDWYRVNTWFIGDSIAEDMVKKHIWEKYFSEEELIFSRRGDEIAKDVEKYFDFKWIYNKEEIEKLKNEFSQKYNLIIEEEYIDDMRGKGYYISSVRGTIEAWNKIFDIIYTPIVEEKKIKNEEFERKKKDAIEEAVKTGKKVYIQAIWGYDGDDWREVQMFGTPEIKQQFGELGWIKVFLVAHPDGTIREEHCPSY